MDLKWDRLIVALDVDDRRQIVTIVDSLAPKGVKFKIGGIAFTKFGPELVREIIAKGADVFLDLKLHDIPNTMRRTAAVMTEMGVWAFTVHLAAGQEALRSVVSEVAAAANKSAAKKAPLILGVTILTSDAVNATLLNQLLRLADAAGVNGVIASAHEAQAIRTRYRALKIVTPGIRNPQDEAGDQKRIMTASQAFSQGADYIVVGRPIISKPDYLAAAQEILAG